jgi:hypothetical protein
MSEKASENVRELSRENQHEFFKNQQTDYREVCTYDNWWFYSKKQIRNIAEREGIKISFPRRKSAEVLMVGVNCFVINPNKKSTTDIKETKTKLFNPDNLVT